MGRTPTRGPFPAALPAKTSRALDLQSARAILSTTRMWKTVNPRLPNAVRGDAVGLAAEARLPNALLDEVVRKDRESRAAKADPVDTTGLQHPTGHGRVEWGHGVTIAVAGDPLVRNTVVDSARKAEVPVMEMAPGVVMVAAIREANAARAVRGI